MRGVFYLPGIDNEEEGTVDVYNYLINHSYNNYGDILKKNYKPCIFSALTDRRVSEFSWYTFPSASNILELGAGWGGSTGGLSLKCHSVTAIERNIYKAKAICKRYSQRNNIIVYAGDYRSLKDKHIYDYVLVHDFEKLFNEKCFHKEDFGEIVTYLMSYVKPDGTLLLNVENKYAAKYWCGEPRDLKTPAFPKIVEDGGVFGFSRSEIEKSLIGIDGMKYKFFYPLFDRHMPQQIFTDDCLPEESSLKSMEMYRRGKNVMLNDERTLYDMCIKEGAFSLFSSAFIVECVNKNGRLSDIQYAKISADRPRKLAMCTVVKSDKVLKMPLFEEGYSHLADMNDYYKDLQSHGIPVLKMNYRGDMLVMPLVKSIKLGEHLRLLAKENKYAFFECLDKLYHYICNSSEHVSVELSPLCAQYPHANWGPVLKRAYIELIDLNCFYDDGFLFYDQEYMRENYPAKYIMYRELINLYYAYPEIEKFICHEEVFLRFGLDEIKDILHKEEYEHFLAELVDTELYHRMMLPHDDCSVTQEEARRAEARRESYLFSGCANKTLVVMGSGVRFKRYMHLYGKRYSPDILVDNNYASWGEEVCGIVISSPEKMAEIDTAKLHVIICVKDYESIEAQLLEMKIYDYRIF